MSNKAQVLQEIRKTIMKLAAPFRHSRHFIWNVDDGLLLWECMRQSPEGLVAGVCSSVRGLEILQQYSRTMEELSRPQLAVLDEIAPQGLKPGTFVLPAGHRDEAPFDLLYFRDILSTTESITSFHDSIQQAAAQNQLAAGWKLLLHQKLPSQGQRLTALLEKQLALYVKCVSIRK
jgi:putative ATPase